MSKVIIFLINIYQSFFSFDRGIFRFLVPGGACKYTLSCSEYTKIKIREYGVVRGFILGGRRVLSCR